MFFLSDDMAGRKSGDWEKEGPGYFGTIPHGFLIHSESEKNQP